LEGVKRDGEFPKENALLQDQGKELTRASGKEEAEGVPVVEKTGVRKGKPGRGVSNLPRKGKFRRLLHPWGEKGRQALQPLRHRRGHQKKQLRRIPLNKHKGLAEFHRGNWKEAGIKDLYWVAPNKKFLKREHEEHNGMRFSFHAEMRK